MASLVELALSASTSSKHEVDSITTPSAVASAAAPTTAPTTTVDEDERQLASQYSDRVVLLKQLAEIETAIRALEVQLAEKCRPLSQQRLELLLPTGNTEIDRVRAILKRCVEDQGGMREGQKIVDACGDIHRLVAKGTKPDNYPLKNHFRNVLVHETIKQAEELMLDVNGSSFLQHALDLFSHGGTVAPTLDDAEYDVSDLVDGKTKFSEILLLIQRVSASLSNISTDSNGTRCVQKLVDCLDSMEEFDAYCATLRGTVVNLVQDLNGTHAVSKLLGLQKFIKLATSDEEFPKNPEQLEMGKAIHHAFFQDIIKSCVDICRNRHGCCVIQRCLLWVPEPYRSDLINVILNNSLRLIQDPFGNYVVQHILDRQQQVLIRNPNDPQASNYTNAIIRKMLHNVATLSCNKFSSNVVEKCLRTSSPDVRQLLVDELTDPQVLPKLLTDGFANYVIQTAIATASDDAQYAQLRDAITPLQSLLKNSPYGVKIEEKLQKRARDVRKQARHSRMNNRREAANANNSTSSAHGQGNKNHNSSSSNPNNSVTETKSLPDTAAASTHSKSGYGAIGGPMLNPQTMNPPNSINVGGISGMGSGLDFVAAQMQLNQSYMQHQQQQQQNAQYMYAQSLANQQSNQMTPPAFQHNGFMQASNMSPAMAAAAAALSSMKSGSGNRDSVNNYMQQSLLQNLSNAQSSQNPLMFSQDSMAAMAAAHLAMGNQSDRNAFAQQQQQQQQHQQQQNAQHQQQQLFMNSMSLMMPGSNQPFMGYPSSVNPYMSDPWKE